MRRSNETKFNNARTSADGVHRLLKQRQHCLGCFMDIVQKESALQAWGSEGDLGPACLGAARTDAPARVLSCPYCRLAGRVRQTETTHSANAKLRQPMQGAQRACGGM